MVTDQGQQLHDKCFNRKSLSALHGSLAGVPSGCHRTAAVQPPSARAGHEEGSSLAGTMQLDMGSKPAPGVATRRPRRVAAVFRKPLDGESVPAAHKVTGEGASHGARGGRAPPLQHAFG